MLIQTTMNTLFPTMIYRKWLFFFAFVVSYTCWTISWKKYSSQNIRWRWKDTVYCSFDQFYAKFETFLTIEEKEILCYVFLYLPFGNAARCRRRHHRHRICLFFLFFLTLMKLESQSNRKQDTQIQWNLNMRRKFGIVIWQLVSVEWCPRGAIIFPFSSKMRKQQWIWNVSTFFFFLSLSLLEMMLNEEFFFINFQVAESKNEKKKIYILIHLIV